MFTKIMCASHLHFFITFFFARDLSFNKSDIILLHKRIDDNWYQGVVMSTAEQLLMGNAEQIGFFPASYVQVLTPLPPDPPQCKALYDFEVNEREEKDCLTFTKVILN